MNFKETLSCFGLTERKGNAMFFRYDFFPEKGGYCVRRKVAQTGKSSLCCGRDCRAGAFCSGRLDRDSARNPGGVGLAQAGDSIRRHRLSLSVSAAALFSLLAAMILSRRSFSAAGIGVLLLISPFSRGELGRLFLFFVSCCLVGALMSAADRNRASAAVCGSARQSFSGSGASGLLETCDWILTEISLSGTASTFFVFFQFLS